MVIRIATNYGLNNTIRQQTTANGNKRMIARIKRLFTRPELVAYNFGQPDCPKLQVGDTLVAVLENDCHDYIAGLCGLDMRIKAGKRVRWKVKEQFSDGSSLLVSGSNRTIDKYLSWKDGSLVVIPEDLCGSEKRIRVYLERW